jgi:CheY-like chemotaxis protein
MKKPSQHILIIEDVPDHAKQIKAALVKGAPDVKPHIVTNVRDALLGFSERGNAGGEPFRLVILDLKIPLVSTTEAERDGGVNVLRLISWFALRPTDVRIVVYTDDLVGYLPGVAGYKSCVTVAKAGADAFVSKGLPPRVKGPYPLEGLPELVEAVKSLLEKDPGKDQRNKQRQLHEANARQQDWCMRNFEWASKTFPGKAVTFFTEGAIIEAAKCKTDFKNPVRHNGFVVVSESSYKTLQSKVFNCPRLFLELPVLWNFGA